MKNKWNLYAAGNFYPLLLILAVSIVYFTAITNDFVLLWDDRWQVMADMTSAGFTPANLRTIFTQSLCGQYSPVNQLCYLAVYTLAGGYNASAFHLFCVVVHLANVLLIYFLFARLLSGSKRIKEEWIKPVAFVTALLFAVHPLNVEAVAWISASKIVVYAFFYVLALYMYVIYVESRKNGYLLLSLFFFLCSFGGKEQAVILPVCLFIIDWLMKRDWRDKRVWLEKLPFLFLACVMGCLTFYFAYGQVSLGGRNYALWQRLVFGSYSFTEYLSKWLMPFNLLYVYPFPSQIGEPVPYRFLFYPLLLTVIALSFRRLLAKWYIAFGLLFFTVNLVMTLHIIPMPRFTIVADRYIYLSSAGLSFIAGYLLCTVYFRYKAIGKYVLLLFALCCLGLGFYARERVKVWKNSDTLKSEIRELLEERNDFLYPDL